jgi:hypothetical protein
LLATAMCWLLFLRRSQEQQQRLSVYSYLNGNILEITPINIFRKPQTLPLRYSEDIASKNLKLYQERPLYIGRLQSQGYLLLAIKSISFLAECSKSFMVTKLR